MPFTFPSRRFSETRRSANHALQIIALQIAEIEIRHLVTLCAHQWPPAGPPLRYGFVISASSSVTMVT
ncbi:MAG TPA: hypothetical protein VHA06_03180, partial [Candidatus Angelobacter sp.]|nr:hypothetical protein [Candidatus Angelobacter sp.]